MSLKDLIREVRYPDLTLIADCSDISGDIKCHRLVIATLAYFDGLLRNTTPELTSGETPLSLRIKLPMKFSTFDYVIQQLYDNLSKSKFQIQKEKDRYEKDSDRYKKDSGRYEKDSDRYKKDSGRYEKDWEVIEALYFLGFPHDQIEQAFLELIDQIDKSREPYSAIVSVLNLTSLDVKTKQAFLARFLYRLSEEEQQVIREQCPHLIPDRYFKGESSVEGDEIILSNDSTFIVGNLKFISYSTCANYEEGYHTGFWVESFPLDEDPCRKKIPLEYSMRIGTEDVFYGTAITYIYTGLEVHRIRLRRNTFRCFAYDGSVINEKGDRLAFPNWFESSLGDIRERYGHILEYRRFEKSMVFEILIQRT